MTDGLIARLTTKRKKPLVIASLTRVAAALVMIAASTCLSPMVAEATCRPPEGAPNPRWTISGKQRVWASTSAASDFVYWPHGGTLTYDETRTAATSATASATVTAEAGVVFAKASTALGVAVGRTWTRSASWRYTANVPADRYHKYRLHLYHESYSFRVSKYYWSTGTCSYSISDHGYPTQVYRAPTAGNSNLWLLDAVRV